MYDVAQIEYPAQPAQSVWAVIDANGLSVSDPFQTEQAARDWIEHLKHEHERVEYWADCDERYYVWEHEESHPIRHVIGAACNQLARFLECALNKLYRLGGRIDCPPEFRHGSRV